MTASKCIKSLEKQFTEYTIGKRKKFNLAEMGIHNDLRELKGTDLQKAVWRELLKIPYGKVVSYSELAKRVRQAKAVRAVASDVGNNPLCIIIPCHRVVPKDSILKISNVKIYDGPDRSRSYRSNREVTNTENVHISVGEYALGRDIKESLLRLEKVI